MYFTSRNAGRSLRAPSKNLEKNVEKTLAKYVRRRTPNGSRFSLFFWRFLLNLGAKIDQKSTKNRPKRISKRNLTKKRPRRATRGQQERQDGHLKRQERLLAPRCARKPDLAGKRKAHLKADGSYWKSKGTMRKEMLRNNVSKGRKKKVNDASEHLEKTEEHA